MGTLPIGFALRRVFLGAASLLLQAWRPGVLPPLGFRGGLGEKVPEVHGALQLAAGDFPDGVLDPLGEPLEAGALPADTEVGVAVQPLKHPHQALDGRRVVQGLR